MSKEIVAHMPMSPVYPQPQSFSFEQLQRIAKTFASSGLFGIKDPDQALALMLIAQAENKNPALIARDFNVINGKASKNAEAMLRDFQASGGRIEWQTLTDECASALFSHPLSPKPVLIDWTLERAKKAGLASKEGGMYTKYTRAMLRSRCISEGVRSTAPGATSQMYTPEELRQIESETQPDPVSITQAVTESAAQVKGEIPTEEVDAMVNSMDVKTMPDLIQAFGKAYTVAKTAGDENAKKRLKSVYDDMCVVIEAGEIV